MKRLFSVLLFVPILAFSQYTSIPDQNFEQALIDLGYDNIIDGQVFTPSISSVTSLDIDGLNIYKLTGIEDFTALTFLYCNDNQLTILDLTNNTSLNRLFCHNNQLTSLDVSSNSYLTRLHCYNNQLTSLDITNNTALNNLFCYDNQLTSLDVSNNTALTYLYCSYNQLTNLDVSQNTALNRLYCNNNQLTNLDVINKTALTHLYCHNNQLISLNINGCTALRWLNVSDNYLNSLVLSEITALEWLNCQVNELINLNITKNIALTYLDCGYNQLMSLDVSNNSALSSLICLDNQLTCLNLKNGNNINFTTFDLIDNPNLNCIEADDPNWATQNWTVTSGNIDNGVNFSTNCNYPDGCFTNSIGEYQSNLSIFPNPTNNIIQVEIENYNGSFQAELYDFTGKLLKTSNNISISLADYPTGIYLLKVAYVNRMEQLKVVKVMN